MTFAKVRIPAKVLVVPLRVKRVVLEQPWSGLWTAPVREQMPNTTSKGRVEQAFQESSFAAEASMLVFRSLEQSGAFSGVMRVADQTLPSAPTIPDFQAVAKQAGADLIVWGELELEGRRYINEIEALQAVELSLFDAATGGKVWNGRETFIAVGRVEGLRTTQKLAQAYLMLAVSAALPGALAGVLPRMVEQMAFAGYRPLISGEELAARVQADILVDVDTPPQAAFQRRRKAYGVVIGIETYRDLPMVDFAVRDAKAVREYLVKVLGVPEENVVMRLNERAARSDLESYLEAWLRNNVEPGSTVFVYYAGHGAPDPKTQEAYLIPYDGNPAFAQVAAYPLRRLYTSLATLPAESVIVWLDACFSGAGGRSVIAQGERPMVISLENPLLGQEKLIVLTAASGLETAVAFPQKRHGLFTYYLLKGLGGAADANQDRAVDLGELYQFVKSRVQMEARQRHREQTPQLLPGTEIIKERMKMPLVEVQP